jgi:HK97 family phage portal protein
MLASGITDLENPALWFRNAVTAPRSAAGINVNSSKADGMAAYFACIKVLGEDVGKLPLHIYRPAAGGGKEKASDHPVDLLLSRRPSPEMSPMTIKSLMTSTAAGSGNAYAEIHRARNGTPIGIYPIHPGRVKVQRNDAGDVVYRVRVEDANVRAPSSTINFGNVSDGLVEWLEYAAADILHIMGPSDDGLVGKSVIRAAADAIGIGLAAQEFGGNFFGNGTHLGGVLMHPGKLGPEASKTLRDSWMKRHQGAARAHRPAVLEEGMKWESIGVAPNEAQFLETRQFQNLEVCRFFRMPPHKIQELGRATWANIESQNIEYVGDTLMPWLVRWQEEIDNKLLTDGEVRDGLFSEYVIQALLMGDSTTRLAFYRGLFQMGAITPNQMREFERMNPTGTEHGDEYFLQTALAPASRIMEPPAPPPPLMPPDDADDTDDDASETEDADQALATTLRPFFVRAAEQALRRESDIKQTPAAYAKHCTYMQSSFATAVQALCGDDARYRQLESFCQAHCNAAVRPLPEPDALADRLMTYLFEARNG